MAGAGMPISAVPPGAGTDLPYSRGALSSWSCKASQARPPRVPGAVIHPLLGRAAICALPKRTKKNKNHTKVKGGKERRACVLQCWASEVLLALRLGLLAGGSAGLFPDPCFLALVDKL